MEVVPPHTVVPAVPTAVIVPGDSVQPGDTGPAGAGLEPGGSAPARQESLLSYSDWTTVVRNLQNDPNMSLLDITPAAFENAASKRPGQTTSKLAESVAKLNARRVLSNGGPTIDEVAVRAKSLLNAVQAVIDHADTATDASQLVALRNTAMNALAEAARTTNMPESWADIAAEDDAAAALAEGLNAAEVPLSASAPDDAEAQSQSLEDFGRSTSRAAFTTEQPSAGDVTLPSQADQVIGFAPPSA